MQAVIYKNYTRGQWSSQRLDMDEEELFDHLTLDLSDLLGQIRINKQKKGDGTQIFLWRLIRSGITDKGNNVD